MAHRPISTWGAPPGSKPLVMQEAWQARFNGLFARTPIHTETPQAEQEAGMGKPSGAPAAETEDELKVAYPHLPSEGSGGSDGNAGKSRGSSAMFATEAGEVMADDKADIAYWRSQIPEKERARYDTVMARLLSVQQLSVELTKATLATFEEK